MTPEELFKSIYNSQVSAGIDRLIMGRLSTPWTQVGSANITTIPTDRQETININLTVEDYNRLINKLHEIHSEEIIRQSYPECNKLWYEYKMWINLHK